MHAEAPTLASQSVHELPGVGTKKANLLAKLKIATVSDLLLHRPRRYEDRRHCCAISEAQEDLASVFQGQIESVNVKRFRHRRGSVTEVVINDGHAQLTCRWWNQPYIARNLQKGLTLLAFGKPKIGKVITIDQPDTEILADDESNDLHMNRVVPIYPLTQGMTQHSLRSLIWQTLESSSAEMFPPPHDLEPESALTRWEAFNNLHFPEMIEQPIQAAQYFAVEELLLFQLKLQTRRLRFNRRAKSPQCTNSNTLVQPFLAILPFELTSAQERVMREIRSDLNRASPMRRLLQGDVGSGKTVVAALTALIMLESGHDVALMAPTELLAEQHFKTLTQWLQALGVAVDLVTGNSKPETTASAPRLSVGTHALIEKAYQPEKLGLVIIDEQHRFGVSQRDKLLRKGQYPHLLTMTATPIPRSLGLTVYGDLEHSILDQSPSGRGQITTYLRDFDRLEKIWQFLEKRIAEGQQAYIVYPRIEQDKETDIKSIESERSRIQARFPQFKIGCLHGQVDREEAKVTMAAFREKKLEILVATSVIEVGVDVPNATIMLIENAERFGLAQLHQMRGRVGRGSMDSHCILVSPKENETSWNRLKILESNRDGFSIAENDLKHRGPGEFLGQQQSGLPRFRFADLIEHRALVQQIRTRVRRHLGLESEAPVRK